MKHIAMACIAGAAWISNAAAQQLSCHVDRKTDRHMCFDARDVRTANGISTAPVYQGGPNSVRKTPYTFAVNCQTRVMHLKDRDGVSFAGAQSTATEASRALTDGICKAASKPSKK